MSNLRKVVISNCEKEFVCNSLAEHQRIDGRAFDEFRNMDIKFGIDYGCVYVSLGKTKVLAQASCEVQIPKMSRPSEGILNINVELGPMAAPNFEADRQSDFCSQINRFLDKYLKESRAVDLESLCIKMNEKVWAVRVDIYVLNHEGNILDCASIAALASLMHFRRPDVTFDGDQFIIHDYKKRNPIPLIIQHHPMWVTYANFKTPEVIIADPSFLEENVADGFIYLAVNTHNELCSFQLSGKSVVSPQVIVATSKKAAARACIVVQKIKEAIDGNINAKQEGLEYGLHKEFEIEEVSDSIKELKVSLDIWVEAGKKRKKKQKEKAVTAEIEHVGKGTAVLLPTDENKSKVWDLVESDNEDDVSIVEISKPPSEIIKLDSDSEEEVVVILNADKKTNKKKKK